MIKHPLSLAAVLLFLPFAAHAQEKPASIVVNTSGGENAPMLRAAYFNDFEASTGVKIVDSSPADFGRLRAMVESGKVEWTVTEVESEDVGLAIKLNLLEKIDDSIVDRSAFPKAVLNPYFYPISSYSTIIGYSTEAFPDGGPTNWKEFWDTKKFPGPRAMRNHPVDNLEAALLADGVAPDQLYPLDLDRAFKKLDEIYPDVAVWWTTGAQQAQLLIDGEVVMTTGWNSRLFAAVQKGAPIKMEYGGGILKVAAYAIPRGAPNAEWGQRFLAVMAKPENQAKYAEVFGLSGPHPDHVKYVREEIRPLLPLSPENIDRQVWMSQDWWLENGPQVVERWTQWMLSKR